MAAQVERRMAKDEDASTSGVIINTCGWVEGAGFDIILHCIKAFSADVVLVMNHDKLYSNLVSSLDGVGTKTVVVKLPASGGIVSRVSRRLHLPRMRTNCINDSNVWNIGSRRT